MSTLLELVNVTRTVKVGELEIEIHGISAEGFINLLTKYPVLMKAMSGGTPDTAEIMKVAPEAVAAFIAAGCGYTNDAKAIKVAASLGVNAQLDLASEIIKATFPSGVGPFVARLEGLGLLVQGQAAKVQSPNSDEPAMNSSDSDTQTQQDTPQGKSPGGSTSADVARNENARRSSR